MDPVTLQVMVGALRAACEEMGVVLVRAAHSANIKERRDASTALFDAHGEMAMQAEHIPVHLGAMPAAVAAVRAEDPDEGDAWVLNDPYRAGIAKLGAGEREARDLLEAPEGDLELRVRATVADDSLRLDFTDSADQHEGNMNCPLAVTLSACYFAVRVLADPDVPPCAGAYRPVSVTAPEGCLLNARPPAAVAAGNVETSSRVADLVLAAFGRALGQGTMNNVTLGNDDFTYYETIAGGQGACPDADGPSAVHVAMSNTLNTPVQALELEFPLRAVEYAVRRGSGGAGRHRGGDGVIRELDALEPMSYSLITERRRHAPPGADGGEDGAPGRNLLDGEEVAPT